MLENPERKFTMKKNTKCSNGNVVKITHDEKVSYEIIMLETFHYQKK